MPSSSVPERFDVFLSYDRFPVATPPPGGGGVRFLI